VFLVTEKKKKTLGVEKRELLDWGGGILGGVFSKTLPGPEESERKLL